eukprot:Clim_evm24s148 gene=Clim_evmTU24s148
MVPAAGKEPVVKVSGLDESVTEQELKDFFSDFGTVAKVRVRKDFTTGDVMGEAFITYTECDVDDVVKYTNGAIVNGRLLTVAQAEGKRNTVAIIGGTLAGYSAAVEALKGGSSVILFDHLAGGEVQNSIFTDVSACGTKQQAAAGVRDDVTTFKEDIINNAGKQQDKTLADKNLASLVAERSCETVEFLEEILGEQLGHLHHVGGHSVPRTLNFQDPNLPLGVRCLRAMHKKISEYPQFRMMKTATVSKIVLDENGLRVTGIEYHHNNIRAQLQVDTVIMATGGFAHNQERLAAHCPQYKDMPIVEGVRGSGRGYDLLDDCGALLTHMDKVLLDPFSAFNLKETLGNSNVTKPSHLRSLTPMTSSGAILVNSRGQRFTNEMTSFSSISRALLTLHPGKDSVDSKLPFEISCAALIIPTSQGGDHGRVLDVYAKAGPLVCGTVEEVCEKLGIDADGLTDTLQQCSDETVDDAFDRKWSIRPHAISQSGEICAALVTPAILYTIGGAGTNLHAQVLQATTMQFIAGLYAAGECSSGPGGETALVGTPILTSVVMGRIAGKSASHAELAVPALRPNAWVPLAMDRVIKMSPTTSLFRFSLPSKYHQTGLGIGQYICVKANIEGEDVVRYYSPISRPETLGQIDLLIKINVGGKFTEYLDQMKPGDFLDWKGPVAGLDLEVGRKRRIGMLAGGTGIAPMIQLIRSHMLYQSKVGNDNLFDLRLIFGVKDESELLLRDQLEGHAQHHPGVLDIYYVLQNPPAGWTMGTGFITKEMIQERCAPPSDEDALIVICGPPVFCNAMKDALNSLGYQQGKNYYSYL